MSDIPDWLVELAAQGDLDEDEETDSTSEPLESERSDAFIFDSGSQSLDASEASPQFIGEVPQSAAVMDAEEDESAQDLMATLRSQVVAGAAEEGAKIEEKSSRVFNLRIPGLLPWQQLVLTILLFLDVFVIGLLVLVMLGRVAIP